METQPNGKHASSSLTQKPARTINYRPERIAKKTTVDFSLNSEQIEFISESGSLLIEKKFEARERPTRPTIARNKEVTIEIHETHVVHDLPFPKLIEHVNLLLLSYSYKYC